MTERFALDLVDLSMEVEEGTNPNYPDSPWLKYRPLATHETGVFASNNVELFLHAGSHVDAPYHFDPEGSRVHELELTQVVGPALVLDVSDAAPGERIDADRLARAKDDAVAAGATHRPEMIALVRTDWSKRAAPPSKAWWDEGPYLDRSAARWLIDEEFTSVGFDFPQDKLTGDLDRLKSLKSGDLRLEDMEDPPLPVHVLLLSHGICQIENITNLDLLPAGGVTVVAAPILLHGAEGAPARVFAIIDR
jgi:kynurenine formamidase